MNWFQRIKQYFDTKSKRKQEKSELEKCNYGRAHGWYIELDGNVIGELVDAAFDDMFWDRYTIIAYEAFEDLLYNHKHWYASDFKYRNKHYAQYADAIPGPEIRKENNIHTITMRALYLTELKEK